mgnify:CR=1 FL=1
MTYRSEIELGGRTLSIEAGQQALERAIKKNTKIVFTESPTNPYLNVIDMERMQAIRRWPRPASAATIAAIPPALSTLTSGSPKACGERWTTAAP